jgi:hypothetical protein
MLDSIRQLTPPPGAKAVQRMQARATLRGRGARMRGPRAVPQSEHQSETMEPGTAAAFARSLRAGVVSKNSNTVIGERASRLLDNARWLGQTVYRAAMFPPFQALQLLLVVWAGGSTAISWT